MLTRYRNYARIIDPLVGFVVGLSIFFSPRIPPIAALIDGLDAEARVSLYQTFASITGSLLGFTIAAVSLVMGMSISPRLRALRASKHYGELWKTFHSAIWWLGFSTVVAVAGLAADRGDEISLPIVSAASFVMVTAALRLINAIWILEKVVELVTGANGKEV